MRRETRRKTLASKAPLLTSLRKSLELAAIEPTRQAAEVTRPSAVVLEGSYIPMITPDRWRSRPLAKGIDRALCLLLALEV
jgi:hypothetical protein